MVLLNINYNFSPCCMKYSRNICIWCLQPANDKDVENIFPEALGCPDFLTLPGSIVCKKCNNNLAHLDRAVSDEFDFFTFTKGVKRKKNRKPEISSRGNVVAKHTNEGPTIFLNGEKHTIKLEDGTRLTPYKPKSRSVKPAMKIQNNIAEVSMSFAFGQSEKFIRGLTKIAVNSFAYFDGLDTITSSRFDSVRDFVKNGGEKRKALTMKAGDNEFKLAIERIFNNKSGDYGVVIRIACVIIMIDLSRQNSIISELIEAALNTYGAHGWATIPQ